MELFDVLKWYLAIQVLSCIGFVLGFKLFSPLKYRGFCVSKTLGLFILSLLCWLACNKIFSFISYSSLTVYLILFALGGFSYYYIQNIKDEILSYIKTNRKYIIYIEIAFLISFLMFVLLRSYTPNIEGTEKPLEFVVINSILNGNYLPSIDAWLAGHHLNYYYLGQFFFCNIIKLTFIDPAIAFNLINPTILSLVLIGSFELIYELTKKISWGILSAFMTGLMGNLEPIVQIINMGWNPDSFRWWDSGHIIPHSFPEFPYWSYLHSDVHAHFLVHPFTILFLFIILSFIKSGNYLVTKEDFSNKKKFTLNIFYCVILGSFMLINSWSYPSAIALTLAGIFIHCYINLPKTSAIINILRVFPPGIFYIMASYIIYLPFYAYYNSPVEGLGIVEAASRTTTGQFLMLIGTFLFPIVVYITAEFINKLILNKNLSIQNKLLTGLALLIITILVYLATRSFVIVITLLIALYFLVSLISRKVSSQKAFIYAISFLVFSLILCCEFIYIDDMFGGEYERQNTVAKSYIQILLLLPIITSYIMYIISSELNLKGLIRNAYIITISLLIITSSLFLFAGTYIKSNKFVRSYLEYNWHIPTLDGSVYIKTKYGGEYYGIKWLKEHAQKGDIVLEIEGRPYSHFGRVSSQTGVPSLINWSGSLNVLRGNFFHNISTPRLNDINEIYSNPDKLKIIQLIRKNKITYIFVGSLERIEYKEEALEGFDKEKDLFKRVFKEGNTSIYKVIK